MTKKLVPAVKRPGMKRVMAVFIMIAAAVLLSMSLADITLAKGRSEGAVSTIQGEVVAVDNLHSMNMLTLRSGEIGAFPNDSLNIFMNGSTKVTVCNAHEPAKDIDVSRNATVTYHEVNGWLAVTDSIVEGC